MHDSVSSSGTPSSRPRRITSDLCSAANGAVDRDRCREPDRQRARESRRRTRPSRPGTDCRRAARSAPGAMPRARHEHGRLRQQDDVAALEVDVLVGRVEAGRLRRGSPSGSADRRRACRTQRAAIGRTRSAGERREESRRHGALLRFPGEADARRRSAGPDPRARRSATQDGAVQAAREEHRGDLLRRRGLRHV